MNDAAPIAAASRRPGLCARARPRRGRQGRRAAGQSRHPRRRRRRVGAPLSQGIPLRSARDREPGPGVAARAQRRHPAHPPAPQGARLRQDLEPGQERIPAQDHHPLAGREARRRAGAARAAAPGRLGDALRQSLDRVAARRSGGARLRPHPGDPALSAVLRRHYGDGGRRSVSRAQDHAVPAGAADRRALLRRPRPISTRWRPSTSAALAQLDFKPDVILASFHGIPKAVCRQGRSLLRALPARPCGCCARSSPSTRANSC